MRDPLYDMQIDDPYWRAELAEEAQSLAVAIFQSDDEGAERKLRELHHAFHKTTGDVKQKALRTAARMLERCRVRAATGEDSDAVSPEEIGRVLHVIAEARAA